MDQICGHRSPRKKIPLRGTVDVAVEGVRKGPQKWTLFWAKLRGVGCEPVRAGNGKRVKDGESDTIGGA